MSVGFGLVVGSSVVGWLAAVDVYGWISYFMGGLSRGLFWFGGAVFYLFEVVWVAEEWAVSSRV